MTPTTTLPVSAPPWEGMQLKDILQDTNTKRQTKIYAGQWQKLNPTKIDPDLQH